MDGSTAILQLLSFALVALPAMAQFNAPVIYSAENSASYAGTIAQGSLFVVFGTNIGPAQLVQAGSYPLPSQIGGTAMTVTSGSTTLPCPMVYSVAGQAAAVLPSNTPLGNAMVMLTYNGQGTPFPALVNVVPSAVGIFTLSSSGLGPGVVTALDGTVKTFAVTAKPGETVIAWATGLGPITGPDNVLPSTFPSFPGVEVFIGTQSASVVYAGRSGCCAGVDQIAFEVPAGLAGCYLPVAIRSGGRLSNFVSVAVNSSGQSCSDTAPTLPAAVMDQTLAGRSVSTAALAAGPVGVLRGLGFRQEQMFAEKLSSLLHVKVSRQDVSKLLRANPSQRSLGRAMRKYAAAWKALDPAAKEAIRKAVNLTQEGALAGFGRYNTPGTLGAAVGGLFPSQGSCTVFGLMAGPLGSTSSQGLDAGSSLALSGPAGAYTLMQRDTGQYQVMFGSTPTGPNLPPGTYAITSSGGRDIEAFSASLTVSGNILWSNKAAISAVDRSQPLTITWSGGATPGSVLIGGYSEFNTVGSAGFVCAEDTSKGTFTIPSFILSALPATPSGGVMFIGPHPLSRQVAIPGVDLAYFIDGSSDSRSVAYQ
ncbi:MAG TPA: hypothetical protein VKG25_23255 [Bryobacteraceae bacterium]|nr:hypothetical protein [Bryobacteraceae bacterium]